MEIPAELRPRDRRLVMELVAEAGFDTTDWANYAGDHPASNPRYCYEWVFTQPGLPSIACLWLGNMDLSPEGVVTQRLNLWDVAKQQESQRGRSAVAKRARALDLALQTAFRKRLPIRVIVVDGDQADLAAQNARSSRVERRCLDPVAWNVVDYDWSTGDCVLARGDAPAAKAHLPASVDSSAARPAPFYVTRLAYNSLGWRRPASAAEVQESGDTYRSENGFGHEDWLFRHEWLLDGWRYGFVQGVNNSRRKLLAQAQPFDLRLFTMPGPSDRRAVAEIRGAECLDDDAAEAAVAAYEEMGWLDAMRAEVAAAGGRPGALDETGHAPHVLNMRYRVANLRMLDPETPLPPDDPVHRLKRYGLYSTANAMDTAVLAWRGRKGRTSLPGQRSVQRYVTGGWITCSPEHVRIQEALKARIEREFPRAEVVFEQDFIDVVARTDDEILLFEVKSDLDPLAVVRQALGQVLEYAYHPRRTHDRRLRLVIVGRRELDGDDRNYFDAIRDRFKLPVEYWAVPV